MSDARQIAERLIKTSRYDNGALDIVDLEKAITAALEAKKREIERLKTELTDETTWKQQFKRERDDNAAAYRSAWLANRERIRAGEGETLGDAIERTVSQRDEAVRLLSGCAYIGMFKSKEFSDEVNAFLDRVKGGKS